MGRLTPATAQETRNERIARVVAEMLKLDDEERMEVMGEFCKFCGDTDPRCQCWNDE